jgi:hypothetical protein
VITVVIDVCGKPALVLAAAAKSKFQLAKTTSGLRLRADWQLRASLVALGLIAGLGVACATESYLDNGVVRVGIDLAKGGSITWLSVSGTTNNVINDHDLGRQVQQSYYSGPQPYDPSNNVNPAWTNWPWNPIQSGDSYGHASTVLAQSNDGHSLYVKCRPMQWALDNVPGQCTFESWISLTDNVVLVSNRLINLRTDTAQQFQAFNQELPAVYTVGTLCRLYSYAGWAPFTGAPIRNLPALGPPNWSFWHATESWAALVDTNGWGVGVYHPGVSGFLGGFYGAPGSGGPQDDPTGYIAPFQQEILDTNIVFTYSYQLILGTLQQIRDWVYAQPYRPDCNFAFVSDRQHWVYRNTTDSGWPLVDNRLRISLNSSDPQLWSPPTAFPASAVPNLYICAALNMANPNSRNVGQLFWLTNGSASFNESQSSQFSLLTDGQFHIYELNLSSFTNYSGLITQLRFDPVYSGDPGDYVDVAWVSSSPFVNNPALRPTLGISYTNQTPSVSFFATSGSAAGFLSQNLLYTLEERTNLPAGSWQAVAGYSNIVGNNATQSMTLNAAGPAHFYRVRMSLQ